jgi:hypothetical protein
MRPDFRSLDEGDEAVDNVSGGVPLEITIEKRFQQILGSFGEVGQTVQSAAIRSVCWIKFGIDIFFDFA